MNPALLIAFHCTFHAVEGTLSYKVRVHQERMLYLSIFYEPLQHMKRNAADRHDECTWEGVTCTDGIITSVCVASSGTVDEYMSWGVHLDWLPRLSASLISNQ